MSVLAWLAPILVALSALCASGLFERARPGLAAALLALAALAATAASWRAGRRGAGLARAPLGVLAAALAVAASAPLLVQLGTRFQRVDVLSPVVQASLRALGYPLERVDGVLYAQRGQLVAITTDWAKLGLLPALWIFLAGAVTVLVRERARPLRAVLGLLSVTGAYTVARYVMLVALALQHPDPAATSAEYPFVVALFLDGGWQTLTFLPLALFLARFLPWRPEELAPRPLELRPRAAVALAAALTAGLAWAVARNHEPPGAPKQGRVVVDERHSRDWSSALAPLDTETYGRDTVYGSTLLVRYLDQFFDVRVNDLEPYSEESLAGVDVLVLKTATAAFAPEEIDAVEAFVRRGGGLFVLGDHTDLLGMTSNLNAVTERFDMRFRKDACNRLEDGQAHGWTPLPWSAHPITADVERLEFMTSCTLEVPADAEELLVARNAFSDPLDYSAPSFFGDVAPDLDDELGLFTVAAAREVDRGRVVMFADSTVLSSFCLTWEGRAELLRDAVAWLDRTNADRGLEHWAGRAALAALVLLLALGLRLSPAFWGGLVPGALLAGAALGVALCPPPDLRPRAVAPLPTIAFLEEGCEVAFPSPLLESDVPDEDAFDVLYTWTARVGLLPVREELPDALRREAVVAVRPASEWLARRGAALAAYVRGGGALMLLADAPEELAPLLEPLDLRVEDPGGDAARLSHADGREVPLAGPRSRTFLARVGRGALSVTLVPRAFSRAGMGEQLDDVARDDPRREMFDELYALLGALVPAATPVGGAPAR